MRIIGHTFSPFTRKVRIVAIERSILADFVIDMPLSRSSTVAAYNPLGKVPVLVCDNGLVLFDSPLIAAYLDALGDGDGLIPSGREQRMAVQQWEAVADGVQDAAILVRAENLRPEGERGQDWLKRQRTKVERGLQWMNDRVEGTYCIGGRFTLADVALGCCVSYLNFRFPECRWSERYPAIGCISLEMEKRASFRATPMRT